jgi:hypothetical protein
MLHHTGQHSDPGTHWSWQRVAPTSIFRPRALPLDLAVLFVICKAQLGALKSQARVILTELERQDVSKSPTLFLHMATVLYETGHDHESLKWFEKLAALDWVALKAADDADFELKEFDSYRLW